ncbi:KxYKxGKxW signal peptide domain-containing protein [Weissella confusa]|uniref:KxYKxGKxW signal peptide domain-containing protein n=1 Tax=Weissella confusa TaxID=1583 RepID=A0A923SNP5_WEICO|nr:KxYKxGKxW signal peptide domain-containing protein [Weissella confusa]
MATSRKERFKLYKAKKRWLIAGLAFAGVAMMSGGQVSASVLVGVFMKMGYCDSLLKASCGAD